VAVAVVLSSTPFFVSYLVLIFAKLRFSDFRTLSSAPLYLNVNVYIVACTSAQQNHEQNPMKNPAVAVAVGVAVAVWQWQWQWQLQWQRSSMESQSPRSAQLRVEKRVA
jgi:predicted cobalt transporter CbtA